MIKLKDLLMETVKLVKVSPGYYKTSDGEYEVMQIQIPKEPWAPAHKVWVWVPRDGEAHDYFPSKKAAVEALAHKIKHG